MRIRFVGPRWHVWSGMTEAAWRAARRRNALILVTEVTERAIDAGYVPPRRYRLAYRRLDRAVVVYAVPPVHWLVRAKDWWHRHRWCIELPSRIRWRWVRRP